MQGGCMGMLLQGITYIKRMSRYKRRQPWKKDVFSVAAAICHFFTSLLEITVFLLFCFQARFCIYGSSTSLAENVLQLPIFVRQKAAERIMRLIFFLLLHLHFYPAPMLSLQLETLHLLQSIKIFQWELRNLPICDKI